MQLLGFTFPPDLVKTSNIIKELPVEYMLRIKQAYKDNYNIYNTLLNELEKSIIIVKCDICEEKDMSYGDLPIGWGWYNANVSYYKLCSECQDNYKKKYGLEPELTRSLETIL